METKDCDHFLIETIIPTTFWNPEFEASNELQLPKIQ